MNILVIGVVMAAMMLFMHGGNHQVRTPPPPQQEERGAESKALLGGCGRGHLSHARHETVPDGPGDDQETKLQSRVADQ